MINDKRYTVSSTHRHRLLKHLRRRQFLQGAAVTIPSLLLSSCGWTIANVSPAASEEEEEEEDGESSEEASAPQTGSQDKLYIYTWAGYTDDELLDRFRQETGIEVVADVFDSNEVMLAKIQASGGGGYSIIYPSEYMVINMVELGILRKLDQSRIRGLDQLFPNFRDPAYDPGNQYSVPLSWGTTGLVYNPNKLSQLPEDWDYLWENSQEIARRVTLPNDVREVMGATLSSLGYSYNSTDYQEIKQAYEKLVELKPTIASLNSDAWRTQILSGDLFMAMCYSSDATEVIDENEDLEYIVPDSGSSVWVDTLVIPRSAPNLDAAYAWINFMLKPEIAARICQRLHFSV
ncbi:MAG: spermidine/putrescine ABC transporter substrate-binding protein, partial [Spirulinaceae cyanobacterium]